MKTTQEKIAVMQAFDEGQAVQSRRDGDWVNAEAPSWDWAYFDYRVKPTITLKDEQCAMDFYPSGIVPPQFTYENEMACVEAMNQFSRAAKIRRLAYDLGGLQPFVQGEDNYTIGKTTTGSHYLGLTYSLEVPGVIWMTGECADKIADMLNDGEFKL